MDFFAQQARVRRASHYMVALFLLAVLAIVGSVDAIAWLFIGARTHAMDSGHETRVLVLTSLVVAGLIGLSALYRMWSLTEGGRAVAEGMGAVPVPPDTTDRGLRQLRNVIEEVAIASGTPVPLIYVMEDEAGINAFAAGHSPADAAICVTQGCLEHLSRDELQGVIAHEFSHVLNGDMRLNIRLMGLLFGIMMIAVVGRQFIGSSSGSSWRRRSSDDDARGWAIGFVLIAIGYVGYFFGRLIQAAIARSREALADASAVQFTRQTHGIAGALKKIAVVPAGSALIAGNRHEVSHMLFGDADDDGFFFQSWFATHPPLLERIRLLDPVFRERDLEKLAVQMQNAAGNPGNERNEGPDEESRSDSFAPSGPLACDEITGAVGASMTAGGPVSAGFRQAADIQRKVPAALLAAGTKPESALSLALALAMQSQGSRIDTQRRMIANAFGDDVLYAVLALATDIGQLSPELRLPLISLVFPALRQLPERRLRTFLETLDMLARAHGGIDVDDYCLVRLLRVQLLEAMRPRSAPVEGRKKLPACRDSIALVLAVLAAFGNADPPMAARAWMQAMDLAFPGATSIWRAPPQDWQEPFERALLDLDGLMPAAKEIFIQCIECAVRADGVLAVAEAELLRVVCASLHCPLPPLKLQQEA